MGWPSVDHSTTPACPLRPDVTFYAISSIWTIARPFVS
jgi:hypothetical protein